MQIVFIIFFNILIYNQILNTDETLYYWNLRVSTTLKLQKQLNKTEQKYIITKKTGEIGKSVQNRMNAVPKMKRRIEVVKVSF
jgi:hypothetical protein